MTGSGKRATQSWFSISEMPYMMQLAAVLLHCEKGFRRIKGYMDIPELIESIERYDDVQVSIAV